MNVASVPKRSPFRYPGGKTWLVPHVRLWLKSLGEIPKNFVEPFAGGGIISLTVASEQLAKHVNMFELDDEVASVWITILGSNGSWLGKQILNFEMTPENARAIIDEQTKSVRKKAFKTILKNRVFHGGILAHGSSMLKHGENGKGILSRWYPTTLKNRIEEISKIKERITFTKGNAFDLIVPFVDDAESVFFIDPPYTADGKKAGKRLYTHHEIDHDQLFEVASKVKGDFLMTYDNAEGAIALAHRYGFDTEPVAMKNTHHAEMKELLIGKNLDWVRRKKKEQREQPVFSFGD